MDTTEDSDNNFDMHDNVVHYDDNELYITSDDFAVENIPHTLDSGPHRDSNQTSMPICNSLVVEYRYKVAQCVHALDSLTYEL